MNKNISQETKQLPIPKNHNQAQINAIAQAMIVSLAWSLTDLLKENRPKNEQNDREK